MESPYYQADFPHAAPPEQSRALRFPRDCSGGTAAYTNTNSPDRARAFFMTCVWIHTDDFSLNEIQRLKSRY